MTERARLRLAWLAVVLVAVVHRALVWQLHRADLDALIAANPGWYSQQYLPLELVRDRLAEALLFLQQTPPVSNVVMGLALKLFSWPAGVAYALIAAQTLLSVLTGVVLVHLLAMLYPGRVVLWAAVGIVFLLNTDLVVVEYNSLGQTIYEPITMLLVLGLLDFLVALRRTGRLRHAGSAGLCIALLALTRSGWSFFGLPGLALTAAVAPARRGRALLACAIPVLLLHGGWTLKNWIVWREISLVTSTWGGLHAISGMGAAGLGDVTARWPGGLHNFQEWLDLPPPDDRSAEADRKRAAHAWDERIDRMLGGRNPTPNRLTFRFACARAQRDFIDFALAHPRGMLGKWWHAFQRFWQPIANYGRQFVALFAVGNRIVDPFDVGDIVAGYLDGTLPDTAYVASGTHWLSGGDPRWRFTPTRLFTLRWLEPITLELNVLGVHILLPLLGLLWAARRLRYGRETPPPFAPLRMTALGVAAVLYGYLAVLANAVETAESMRYRLEVEPVCWVITVVCLTELGRRVIKSRRAAVTPASARECERETGSRRRQNQQ